MISEEQCENALKYLAATDETGAILKGQVASKEYLAKLARSRVFLLSEGSVEARKATAEISEEVQAAEMDYCTAVVEFEKVRAKRATRELVVETWRSVNANRRHGNL